VPSPTDFARSLSMVWSRPRAGMPSKLRIGLCSGRAISVVCMGPTSMVMYKANSNRRPIFQTNSIGVFCTDKIQCVQDLVLQF
jgi:hypothetical protein